MEGREDAMNINKNAYVITLTGPSGCGKSEIINILCEIGKTEQYDFIPMLIPKYTTRAFRKKEIECIEKNTFEELDVIPVHGKDNVVCDKNGNILPEEMQKEIRRKAFKQLNCDLVYEQYGNQYGIHFSSIYECLKVGRSPIIILNDVRTVEDIRTFLGKKCISLFVFRKVPLKEDFYEIGKTRNTEVEETEERYEKANAIYRIYIENIHLFDKLILNTQNGYDSLRCILMQLVESMCEKQCMFVDER